MNINSFPSAPAGPEAWPWSVPKHDPPLLQVPGMQLPKISLITPSFNQAAYLEETIRSVLLQRYPNLEYIIVDGGSHDDSVDIIKKYEPWLASWSSGPDEGQSDAINRGFRISSGDIVSWLCSDDLLRPNALWKVAFEFMREPEMDVLAGACRLQYDWNMQLACWTWLINYAMSPSLRINAARSPAMPWRFSSASKNLLLAPAVVLITSAKRVGA
jgi:glycosyltransferase involved in cell wall biosynthesis